MKRRSYTNKRDRECGMYTLNAKMRVINSDDANDPAWYVAVIDSVD